MRECEWGAMRKAHVTESYLKEALRNEGEQPDAGRVQAAHLERNGDISIITKQG